MIKNICYQIKLIWYSSSRFVPVRLYKKSTTCHYWSRITRCRVPISSVVEWASHVLRFCPRCSGLGFRVQPEAFCCLSPPHPVSCHLWICPINNVIKSKKKIIIQSPYVALPEDAHFIFINWSNGNQRTWFWATLVPPCNMTLEWHLHLQETRQIHVAFLKLPLRGSLIQNNSNSSSKLLHLSAYRC